MSLQRAIQVANVLSHYILHWVYSWQEWYFLHVISPWKILGWDLLAFLVGDFRLAMPKYCKWKNLVINSIQAWEESAPLIYIIITPGQRISIFWVASMILEGFSFCKSSWYNFIYLYTKNLYFYGSYGICKKTLKLIIIMLLICSSNGKLNFISITGLGSR